MVKWKESTVTYRGFLADACLDGLWRNLYGDADLEFFEVDATSFPFWKPELLSPEPRDFRLLMRKTGAAKLEAFDFVLGAGLGLFWNPGVRKHALGNLPPSVDEDETTGFVGVRFGIVLFAGLSLVLNVTVFLPVFAPGFLLAFVADFLAVFTGIGLGDIDFSDGVFAAGFPDAVFGFLAGFSTLDRDFETPFAFAGSRAFFAANFTIRLDRRFGVVRAFWSLGAFGFLGLFAFVGAMVLQCLGLYFSKIRLFRRGAGVIVISKHHFGNLVNSRGMPSDLRNEECALSILSPVSGGLPHSFLNI
jgi:hypothetical protein